MNRLITPKLSKAGCLYLSVLLLTPAWAVERQSLSGHVPAVTARLQPVGRLPGYYLSRAMGHVGMPIINISNACAEGFNSTIQLIKANARGFRNFTNYRARILFHCGKLNMSLG